MSDREWLGEDETNITVGDQHLDRAVPHPAAGDKSRQQHHAGQTRLWRLKIELCVVHKHASATKPDELVVALLQHFPTPRFLSGRDVAPACPIDFDPPLPPEPLRLPI